MCAFVSKPAPYLDDEKYVLPVETCAKCSKCGVKLGAQDPGYICGFCKFIKYEVKR